MKRSLILQRVLAAAAFGILVACGERELVTAPQPKVVQSSSSVMASLAAFSGDLDAQGGATLALPSFAFPEGVKVAVTISGSIMVYSAPQAQYFTQSGSTDPWGVPIGGVYQQCSLKATVKYGATSSGPPPNCTPWGSSKVWIDTVVVSGSGTAIRGAKIPNDSPSPCDTMVCNSSSGANQVAIVPLAGDLDLSARYYLESSRLARKALFIHPFTNDYPYAYQDIGFNDSTTPRGLPLKVLLNSWTMADSTAPGGYWGHSYFPGCLGINPPVGCTASIRETGTYTSRARVNGVEHEDFVTIYCAESEPLLNNDLVRQQMRAALDSSNAWSTDQLQVNERTFFVLQDTLTSGAMPYVFIFPRGPNDDLCNGTPQMPQPSVAPANTKILAWGHDHPFEATDPNPVNRLAICKDKAGRRDTFYGAEGASPEDRKAANDYNDPTVNPGAQAAGWLPMSSFIIDIHNVYVLRPGQQLGDELASGNKFNWDGLYPTDPSRTSRRCMWPKRVIQ
jgi:hypothetical protein